MTPKTLVLTRAVLEVLRAHGLPEECFDGPVQWQGNAKQAETLENLHRALLALLPPLPERWE